MNEIVRRTKWAELIRAAWKQSTECILETGRLLTKAKADLEHGEWLNLVNAELHRGTYRAAFNGNRLRPEVGKSVNPAAFARSVD